MTFSEVTLLQERFCLPSVTPNNAGCQVLIGSRLMSLGFSTEWLSCGAAVSLWARYGDQAPPVCFAGYTDAVSVQNPDDGVSPLISGTLFDNNCYGDMTSCSYRQEDRDNPFFPLTTAQPSSRSAGIGANHAIAPEDVIKLSFWHSTASTHQSLFDPLSQDLDHAGLDDQPGCTGKSLSDWDQAEALFDRLSLHIFDQPGILPKCATDGGMLEECFLDDISDQPVEFGLNNATIHQGNEYDNNTELSTRQPFLSKRLASS